MYTDEMIKFILSCREDGMTWEDIREEFNLAFETKKSANAIRKTIQRLQNSQSELVSDDTLVKNLKATYSAKKTASKVRQENKVLVEHQLEMEDFVEQIREAEKQYPVKLHKKVNLPKKKKTKRTVVAHMSDTHVGAEIHADSMDGINLFNPKIAARRIAYYVKQVTQYKPHHREDSDLVLVLNGDIIHGVIHGTDTANVLPASKQHTVALRIFAQAISFLAQSFSKVRVVCESGNHGRFTHKLNKGRQTEEKWDSFETILYTSLMEKFLGNKNIEFILTKSPYTILDIQGHKALITHGDTVISVGNPGKSINVDSITKQINAIAAGLGYRIDMVLVGHVHKSTYVLLDNGTHLIINGCLGGTDEYAQSLGIVSNNPIQEIFEVTPEMTVGDMRFVLVNKEDDNADLDKIIELDEGMF
jgi:hypothetical protein